MRPTILRNLNPQRGSHSRMERDRDLRVILEHWALDTYGEPIPFTFRRVDAFRYPGLFNRPVITDLLILESPQLAAPLVIATERSDNPGASITNTIEQLAAAVAEREGWQRLNQFLLFEHYPPGRHDDPTIERSLALVTLNVFWQHPKWQHLTIDELLASIGAALRDR